MRVAGDRADPIGEFNAQWHRLADAGGILDEDGVFLIDTADHCTGSAPWDWTPVRLTDRWDLAGVLGERPGEPKFVALSTDGDSLLGTTSGATGIRLVVVDRMRERREAAARATARETPEERAVAWESAVAGLDPSGRLLTSWANGLALNPATPDDLRAGLQGRSTLPQVQRDADGGRGGRHGAPGLADTGAVGRGPAEHHGRSIDQSDPRRAERAARVDPHHARGGPARRAHRTGLGVAVDRVRRCMQETARLSGLSAHLLTVLAADPEWTVRAAACRRAWPHLPSGTQHKLLGDPEQDEQVRAQALLQHHQDHPMPRSVFLALAADFASDTADGGFQDRAVKTCRSGARTRRTPGPPRQSRLRRSLAGSPGLDPDLVALLGRDQDESVRFAVSTRPDLTEEQRVGIDIDFDHRAHHCPLDWVTDLHGDPAALRRLAASAHPSYAAASPASSVFRRTSWNSSPGRGPRRAALPRRVLRRRARHAAAGVAVVDREPQRPDRPHGHPNFPRHDLLRHADDPNPRMRQLALDDPGVDARTGGAVEPGPGRRRIGVRAAKDPRLTAASAVRLLDDPHGHIRHAAFWHARFPARVVVRLLRDPDTAEPAARHPSLPVPVMQRMLQLLQLHPPLS